MPNINHSEGIMGDREFCNRLKALRLNAGLTQAELERRAELPYMLVSHYEAGRRAPGLANIKAIIRGLGCKADDLLGSQQTQKEAR